MKGKEFLNAKLTPFDAELCRMVESLTGKPCEPQWWNLTQYRIIVDYSIRPEPDFVSAVIDAIAGRAGQRFVDVKDKPEESKCGIIIAFSNEPMPFCYGDERNKMQPELSIGDDFCRSLEQIKAIQVARTDLERLQKFVGGGEMRIPRCPGCPGTFHFINGSVFLDVAEGDYICAGKNGQFFVVDEDTFLKQYERK